MDGVQENDRKFYKALAAPRTKGAALTDSQPPPPPDVVRMVKDIAGEQAFKAKVDQKALALDNRAQREKTLAAEKGKDGARTKKRPRPRPVNSRERNKTLKLFDFSNDDVTYECLQPLNHLWAEYFVEMRSSGRFSGSEAKLCKADYHGAELVVIRSKSPSLVGLRGIVVQETERVFRMVTPESRAVMVPKRATVFSLCLPEKCEGERVIIHGNHFMFKPHDRSSRKFKVKKTVEL